MKNVAGCFTIDFTPRSKFLLDSLYMGPNPIVVSVPEGECGLTRRYLRGLQITNGTRNAVPRVMGDVYPSTGESGNARLVR